MSLKNTSYFSDDVFSSDTSTDGLVDDPEFIHDSKQKGVFIRWDKNNYQRNNLLESTF